MVVVKICSGTVCHVMGGSDLPLLFDFLPNELKSKVRVESVPCFGNCTDGSSQKPPFAEVNGEFISEASFPKIIEKIQKIVK